MALYAFPYGSIDDDRMYDDGDFTRYFSAMLSNGAFLYDDDLSLRVTASGDSLTIAVKKGAGIYDGRLLGLDSDENVDLVPFVNSKLNRIVRITLRDNRIDRIPQIVVIAGTPAATPIAPPIERGGDNNDLCLAEIYLPAGASKISQSVVADTRKDAALCGAVRVLAEKIELTAVLAQFNAWITETQADTSQQLNAIIAEFASWVVVRRQYVEQEETALLNQLNELLKDGDVAGNIISLIYSETAKQLAAAKLAARTNNATATLVGTVVTITSTEPPTETTAYSVTFDAPADFDKAHAYSIDGANVSLTDLTGGKLAKSWRAAAPVSITRRGEVAYFTAGTGGASGMDIAIEAVASVADLPQIAENGEIRIITNTPVGATVVDTIMPALANIGDVYIEISEDKTVPIINIGNAQNAINVRARHTYQHNGKKYVQHEAYVGMAGAWQLVSKNGYIYGVSINTEDSNPNTALTYIDDSASFLPAVMRDGGEFVENGWLGRAIFGEMYPCVLKAGREQYRLNKADLTKKEDGTAADITTGNDGDAMRYTPEMWLDVEGQRFRISNVPREGWLHVPAHYWPLYGGYLSGGKLRSLSGKSITVTQTRAAFRGYAVASGTGYQQLEYLYMVAEQVLFAVMFKSLDGQAALGRGYVTEALAKTTGTHNTRGACWGSQTVNSGAVFMWSEVTWESVWYFVDGFWTDGSNVMHVKHGGPYTDSTTGMESVGVAWPASSIAKRFDGNNAFGIWPSAGGGSTSTYYCDNFYTGTGNNILLRGGDWAHGLTAGPFFVLANNAAASSNANVGAAISFTP